MKTRIIILICALTCAMFTNSLFAATEQWSVDIGAGTVMELRTDGSGGCVAVASISTGLLVLWLDKKGKKLYEQVITTGTPSITAITKKNLVYQLQGANTTQVQIDSKGRQTVLSSATEDIKSSSSLGVPYSPMGDKKGFFVWKVNKTTGEIKIVRYSYK